MKKISLILLILAFIAGCGGGMQKEKNILAKVNNYEITKEEFEQEFSESSFAKVNTERSRKDFLENLITRKLILQDAQAKGLDKEKRFLKTIEKFWEQSLFKIAVDKKTKEIAGSVSVSDKEIEAYYNNLRKEGKTDKLYEQAYSQLKWEITKHKESEALSQWLAQLRKNADIKIAEAHDE